MSLACPILTRTLARRSWVLRCTPYREAVPPALQKSAPSRGGTVSGERPDTAERSGAVLPPP